MTDYLLRRSKEKNFWKNQNMFSMSRWIMLRALYFTGPKQESHMHNPKTETGNLL